MTAAMCASLWKPNWNVIVAGFQYMDETSPEPEAAPAKDMPCAVVLCSRRPKAPAWAPPWAAMRAAKEMAARDK